MSTGIERFDLRDNNTWESVDGKLFVSITKVPSEGPITVTVGALGCDNLRKEMIVGDLVQFDAASRGKFEIRLQSLYTSGGDGRAFFHIAKIS